MNIFRLNDFVLKNKNPDLYKRVSGLDFSKPSLNFEIINSKLNGIPSFKINGLTVHSAYNPIAEAKKWADSVIKTITAVPNKIIIFGLGFGYHIEELINGLENKFGKDNGIELIAIEPEKKSFTFILHNFNISELLNKITVYVPDNAGQNIGKIADELHLNSFNSLFCELPSYKRIFGSLYDTVYKSYNINQLFSPSSFRVLIVQPIYGGSTTIGNYIHKAFLNCGYDAKILDFTKFYDGYKSLDNFSPNEDHIKTLRDMMLNLLSEALLSAVFNDKPDLVFFMAQAPVSERTILRIRNMGIKTAYWFAEDYHLLTHWNKFAKHVDFFFTIQKDNFFDELKSIGLNNYYYIPMACLPDFHKKIEDEYKNEEDIKKYGSDVSFAGAGYYNRRNVFKQLTDFNFKIWGSEWQVKLPLSMLVQDEGRRFTEEEAVKIYNYSKININLHSSFWHREINPDGDFLNPRVYEILGCGGFQLVDYRKYMDESFEIGKDFVVFKDTQDLRNKIKYYLRNENERTEIAEHGYNTVRKYHTYEQRVREIMNIITLNSYDSIKPKLISRKENISALLKETENNKELHDLLSKFADKGQISISEIVDYIRQGEGRLSRTEAMILMLWAVKSKLVKLD